MGNTTVPHLDEVFGLFIIHEKDLLAETDGRFLKWVDINIGRAFNKVEEEFYEVFPNPYYG